AIQALPKCQGTTENRRLDSEQRRSLAVTAAPMASRCLRRLLSRLRPSPGSFALHFGQSVDRAGEADQCRPVEDEFDADHHAKHVGTRSVPGGHEVDAEAECDKAREHRPSPPWKLQNAGRYCAEHS